MQVRTLDNLETPTVKPLYLIALVPDESLRERVKMLKEEMGNVYGACHALKSPAHITLQMPFRYPEAEEPGMLHHLMDFASDQEAFLIRLSGFDCFPPRVLFIGVEEHLPIIKLHSRLMKYLQRLPGFPAAGKHRSIHPHMTIATRDLKEESFQKAWKALESREFEASFQADRLYLLKHNGRRWELFKEFPFKGLPE